MLLASAWTKGYEPQFSVGPNALKPIAVMAGRVSSCDLLGIDAYAEDDLGYAPS